MKNLEPRVVVNPAKGYPRTQNWFVLSRVLTVALDLAEMVYNLVQTK